MVVVWTLIHGMVGIVAIGTFWNPTRWHFSAAAMYTGHGTEFVMVGAAIVFCVLAYYYGVDLVINLMDGDHFFAKVILLTLIYWFMFVGLLAAGGFLAIDTFESIAWHGIIWSSLVLGLSKAERQQSA